MLILQWTGFGSSVSVSWHDRLITCFYAARANTSHYRLRTETPCVQRKSIWSISSFFPDACRGRANGVIPYGTQDCRSFIQCVNGRQNGIECCPSGTVFIQGQGCLAIGATTTECVDTMCPVGGVFPGEILNVIKRRRVWYVRLSCKLLKYHTKMKSSVILS